MSIIRCPRGHFYDNSKYVSCPVCHHAGGPRRELDVEKTVSLEQISEEDAQTVYLHAEPSVPEPVRVNWNGGGMRSSEAQSGICSKDTADIPAQSSAERFPAAEPLAGWIVCVAGSSRGMDFRLYPGFNRIGRSPESDVCVQDPKVSVRNHCSVVYDGKGRRWYLVPGKGSVTYLDGKPVESAIELADEAVFELGDSRLELKIFCREGHGWET